MNRLYLALVLTAVFMGSSTVNAAVVDSKAPVQYDEQGRPLPQETYVNEQGQVITRNVAPPAKQVTHKNKGGIPDSPKDKAKAEPHGKTIKVGPEDWGNILGDK
jgi:hypothetical protein